MAEKLNRVLENPGGFHQRICKICGKPGALASTGLAAPQLGAGRAHFDCLAKYEAEQIVEKPCSQCSGKGEVTIMFSNNPAPGEWQGVWDYETCRRCDGSGFEPKTT